MSSVVLNVVIVLALIVIEGMFVAAEIALVTLREGQARAMTGRRGAAVIRLTSDPNRFLATVQIGVTLTALLSSAFGAVTLSEQAKDALVDHGMRSGLAGPIGFIGVTLLISFVTLVVGELVPKRLGLQRADRTAKLVSPTLNRLATAARPLIWLLSRCTDLLVRMLGGDPNTGREAITEEELRGLVAAHESLSTDERRLIDDVFAAGERSVSEVMVPRTEVTFLDAGLTVSRAAKVATESPHSRYPVVGKGQDDVRGFVHIRDLLVDGARGERDRTVGDLVREIKQLPGSKNVLAALSEMRREGHHLAMVVDEYGGTDGIVTLEDLIEEVIGDIRDEYDEARAGPSRLGGGAIEVDGRLNLDDFAEFTGLDLPDGPYETAGGFMMSALGRLPSVGDEVLREGYTITVTAVDGRRAERVRVTPPRQDEAAATAEPSEPPA
ncbi:MAG TPA: hemolysin family protein [Jatrophihabitantaceae bacterium]|nr:hemolysin family protein [Jatrophihabitantaceae bacterium]